MIGTALILIIGAALARFVSDLVATAVAAAGGSNSQGLGIATRGALIAMAFVLLMGQPGIETQLLSTAMAGLVAALAGGVPLAFAVSTRLEIEALVAGHDLRPG